MEVNIIVELDLLRLYTRPGTRSNSHSIPHMFNFIREHHTLTNWVQGFSLFGLCLACYLAGFCRGVARTYQKHMLNARNHRNH